MNVLPALATIGCMLFSAYTDEMSLNDRELVQRTLIMGKCHIVAIKVKERRCCVICVVYQLRLVWLSQLFKFMEQLTA